MFLNEEFFFVNVLGVFIILSIYFFFIYIFLLEFLLRVGCVLNVIIFFFFFKFVCCILLDVVIGVEGCGFFVLFCILVNDLFGFLLMYLYILFIFRGFFVCIFFFIFV